MIIITINLNNLSIQEIVLQLLVMLQDKETYCYRERYDNNNNNNKFKLLQ